jgi:hypothetical protein
VLVEDSKIVEHSECSTIRHGARKTGLAPETPTTTMAWRLRNLTLDSSCVSLLIRNKHHSAQYQTSQSNKDEIG